MRNVSVFNRTQGIAIGIAALTMLALAWVRGIYSMTNAPLTWTLVAVAAAALITTLAAARSSASPRLGVNGQIILHAVVWGGFAASSVYAGLTFHDNSLLVYGAIFATVGVLSATGTVYLQRERTQRSEADGDTPPSSLMQIACLVGLSVTLAVMINHKGGLLDSPVSIGATLITVALIAVALVKEHQRESGGFKRELTPQQSLLLIGALFVPSVVVGVYLGSLWNAVWFVGIGLFCGALVVLSKRREQDAP